jgi:hypothetical protein
VQNVGINERIDRTGKIMRLDSETLDNSIVFLDGKRVMGVLEADDTEGWVDILDPSSLTPLLVSLTELDKDDADLSPVEEWEEAKVIRKFGRVTFILPKK